MSLRQRQEGILRLNFDPSIKIREGDKRHFEWAIDHEEQVGNDWCWAACLKGALSCFGYYVRQDEIVERFQLDRGESPDSVSDDRIPTPEDVKDLWRSYGFYQADWKDEKAEPTSFEALAEEIAGNGPVQIELWQEGAEEERHLALICGVRETSTGPEVFVSDPLAKEPEWYSYEKMQGADPLLSSNFGEWRRTYINLEYQKGYLRRFFGRPSRFLAKVEPEEGLNANGAALPQMDPVVSRLQFETTPPDPIPLSEELSIASYGYRHFRWRTADPEKKEARKDDLAGRLFLWESIPVWRPPFEIDAGRRLRDQLSFYCWHHQLCRDEKPRYYAHSWHFPKLRQRFDRAWRTAWFGERWMVERVNDAIKKLDSDFAGHEGEVQTVRMVWFRRYSLVTFLLLESGQHLVVSARKAREKVLPLRALISDERLQAILAEL